MNSAARGGCTDAGLETLAGTRTRTAVRRIYLCRKRTGFDRRAKDNLVNIKILADLGTTAQSKCTCTSGPCEYS